MDAKLGGYLIGYGLKKKNGDFKQVIFDTPIHNTITKHCLNNLLMFNGTNAVPTGNYTGNYMSIFVKYNGTCDRYGVFDHCGLGSRTGNTDINDTGLKNLVGEITRTKKTGNGWCGTIIDSPNACVKLRISHTHNITNDFAISEIGWFNRIYPSGEFTLSSRVQLDTPVTVESGDTFFSIYEIVIAWQGIERFSDLAGLGSGYKVNGINVGDSRIGLPLIDTNGNPYSGATHSGGSGYSYPRPKIFMPWSINQPIGPGDFRYQYICKLGADYNKLLSFSGSTPSSPTDGSKISNIVIHDYIQDTYYRDFEFVCSPDFFDANTYGIFANGTLYRFGTFDENDNFTPTPITINSALKIKVRQSWSTDLLQPSA